MVALERHGDRWEKIVYKVGAQTTGTVICQVCGRTLTRAPDGSFTRTPATAPADRPTRGAGQASPERAPETHSR